MEYINSREFLNIQPSPWVRGYSIGANQAMDEIEHMSPSELAQFYDKTRRVGASSKMYANIGGIASAQCYAAAELEDETEATAFAAIAEMADVDRFWQLRDEQPNRRDGFDSRSPAFWAENVYRELIGLKVIAEKPKFYVACW